LCSTRCSAGGGRFDDRSGDSRGNGAVERIGQDSVHGWRIDAFGERFCRRDLDLLGDLLGATVERAAKDPWEDKSRVRATSCAIASQGRATPGV